MQRAGDSRWAAWQTYWVAIRARTAAVPPARSSLLFFAALAALWLWPAPLHLAALLRGEQLLAAGGDAWQQVWGLWHVKEALLSGQNPLHTGALFFPAGTSLVLHDLGLTNGLLALPLALIPRSLSEGGPVAAYNALVVFHFIFAGCAAAALARRLLRLEGWWPLLAGALFACAPYWRAHADGHLTLIATGWLPLSLLLVFRCSETPLPGRAAAAALALLATLFSNYYYGALALALVPVFAWLGRSPFMWTLTRYRRTALTSWALFAVLVIVPAAWLANAALHDARALDPAFIGRNPAVYSLNAADLLIPGSHWRFAALTQPVWDQPGREPHERDSHLGLAVLALAVIGFFRFPLSQVGRGGRGVRTTLAIIPFVSIALALGPQAGLYRVAQLIPGVALAGVPARLILPAVLALSLLAAAGANRLRPSPFTGRGWGRGSLLALALVLIVAVEFLPARFPVTRVGRPRHVAWLSAPLSVDGEGMGVRSPAPRSPVLGRGDGGEGGALLDLADAVGDQAAMLWQTMHGRPTNKGAISRPAAALAPQERRLRTLAAHGDWSRLHALGFDFLLVDRPDAIHRSSFINHGGALPVLATDRNVILLDLRGAGQ